MKRSSKTPLSDAEIIAIRRLSPAWPIGRIATTFNTTRKRVNEILSSEPPALKKAEPSKRGTKRSYDLFRKGYGKYS